MSASFPYQMMKFEPPLDKYNTVIMEADITVSNPADPSKSINLLMMFDTGASISLGPRSVATLLDLNYNAGVPLILQGVGGATFPTKVHVLKAEMTKIQLLNTETMRNRPLLWFRLNRASKVMFDLPIAIAETEDFELLLGMLGTIDGIAEFRCDNLNEKLWFQEQLTKPYLLPSVGQIRSRLTR